jgi:predicted adenine nucleotide alpha hydrolase (AANH) superfamily ATPase
LEFGILLEIGYWKLEIVPTKVGISRRERNWKFNNFMLIKLLLKLLLHVCCGPCSTHVAEVLSKKYKIIAYFYNPNIYPYEEWLRRYKAFQKVAQKSNYFTEWFPKKELTKEEWQEEHQKFLEAIKGLENEPEGGRRCEVCFKLRLEETAKFGKNFLMSKADYYETLDTMATTLTIGPNKKADVINAIGEKVVKECFSENSRGTCGIKFYAADFKKEGGFLHSVKLSKEFGLYRQNYCGCEFSMNSKNQ